MWQHRMKIRELEEQLNEALGDRALEATSEKVFVCARFMCRNWALDKASAKADRQLRQRQRQRAS